MRSEQSLGEDAKANAAGEKLGARPWAILALLMFTYVISFIDRNIIALMIEPIKVSLGINDFQVSLLQGLSFVFFFAMVGLPVGWMVDRYARKFIIFGGMTVWSFSASSCALATNYVQLALGRFGVGAGEAALSPAAYSMIADMFPRRKLSLAINIFAAGSTLGSALALIVGGMAVSEAIALGQVSVPFLGQLESWQLVFLVTGLPGLLVAPIYLFVREPPRRSHYVASSAAPLTFGQHMIVNRRYHLAVFGGMALITTLAYAFGAWFPSYLLRVHDLPIREVGLLIGTICAVCGLAGYLTSGLVADYFFARGKLDVHLRLAMLCCAVATLAAVIGIGWQGDLNSALFAAGIIYFILPFSQALTSHLQIVTPSNMRGRASALYVFAFNLVGQAFGPSIVAAFTDYLFHDPQSVGVSLAFTYALIGPVAMLVLMLGTRPARELMLPPER